ncbi:UNVERIFIED_CONTAM: hypothetical protein FKN15_067413 [Acipenser sinensis]
MESLKSVLGCGLVSQSTAALNGEFEVSARLRSGLSEHRYESSAEVLPHTPRLTHFPTVSGSPASLANSMQQKPSSPRRRHHNPTSM